MGKFTNEKQVVLNYFEAMDKCTPENLVSNLSEFLGSEYEMRSVYPFRVIEGGALGALETLWKPLKTCITHMERRQDIFIAGDNMYADDEVWVMSMGNLKGLFDKEYLGIRPTGKIVNIQYAEFNCVKENKIIKTALWIDLISLMKQADAYPLPPMTGHYYTYPGPKRHNGLLFEDAPAEKGAATLALVSRMCNDLVDGGLVDDNPEINVTHEYSCEVYSRTFASNMTWYGPCGIGATYTIPRYMLQHQGPFSEGLGDMKFFGHKVRFAEGNFACWFGWPNLENRNTGGFMGLPEGKGAAGMFVVDIYSCYEGFIEENWVFIDIAYWLKQQNLDVFKRTATILNPKEPQLL